MQHHEPLSADTSFTSFADADDLMPAPPPVNTGAELRGSGGSGGAVPRTASGAQLRNESGAGGTSADNPTPQLVPPPTHAVAGTIGEKHVLVMARPHPHTHAPRKHTRTHAHPSPIRP
jgi:hypothetical protein